jgi:hypothetical protein
MSDRETNAQPLVKGIGFVGVFKFIKIQHDGDKILERIKAQVSPETARILNRKVITVMDYPYPAFVELLRAVDREVGFGDLSLCQDIGEYASNRDYEFFFGPNKGKLKPADLFRDCNIYWKSYYANAGYMKADETSPEGTYISICDFPAMDPAHCRLMTGWMAQAMINAGAIWIEYRESKCASRGDACHEFFGRWRLQTAGEVLPKKSFVRAAKAAKA